MNSYRRMMQFWKSFNVKYLCVHVFSQCFSKELYLEQMICTLSSSKQAYRNSVCIQITKEEQKLSHDVFISTLEVTLRNTLTEKKSKQTTNYTYIWHNNNNNY
jgi:hypothetical protein